MEVDAPALRIILRVERNGAVCRPRRTAVRLPILLISNGSNGWRDVRFQQGNQQCWPPWRVQALIVAILGPLIGVAAPILMQALGY